MASLGRGIFFKNILHTSKISEGGINKVMVIAQEHKVYQP